MALDSSLCRRASKMAGPAIPRTVENGRNLPWMAPTHLTIVQNSMERILVTPASIELCLIGRKTREHSTHDGNSLNKVNRDGEGRVLISPEKN